MELINKRLLRIEWFDFPVRVKSKIRAESGKQSESEGKMKAETSIRSSLSALIFVPLMDKTSNQVIEFFYEIYLLKPVK